MHDDYDAPPLEHADPDPIIQFKAWFADAQTLHEPEAMVLTTADVQSRYVLLRGVGPDGFRFFTNYESAKGRAIAADPRVALTFGWLPQHRSVRVTGTATKLAEAESDAYFAGRPRGSQVGAWASPQSTVIDAPVTAQDTFGDVVPRPPFWGGYLVTPTALEFWQGRPSRLHDRLRYRLEDGQWRIERLAP